MSALKFTRDHFSFVCPMQWDDMQESSNGKDCNIKFCNKCEKEVIDVTDCSLEEVAQLQRKDKHLCVALRTVLTTSLALGAASCAAQYPRPVVTSGVPVSLEHHQQQKEQTPSHQEPKQCPTKDQKKPPSVIYKLDMDLSNG
ncbi:MAG: hypothetical protein V3U78_06950 [Thiotrichaceae bacterium]